MKYLILPLVLFSFFAGHSQTAAEWVKKGDLFLTEKKLPDALNAYNSAWKKDSTLYEIYTGRGLVYAEMKEFEKSFLDFTRATELQPDSALAYHYRANLMLSLLYSDESIIDNTRAIERATNDKMLFGSFLNRGTAKQQKRDFQGAYEDFMRCYTYDTLNIAVINNIGIVLDELGRRDESILYLQKAIRIDSSFMGPYVNIGFQYTLMGKYKESLPYFDKALQLEKDEPVTLNNRGFARYKLNDLEGAMEDISKSIEGYPANSYAFKNRALVYLAMNKGTEACNDLKRAKELQFEKQYGPEVNELLKKHCGN